MEKLLAFVIIFILVVPFYAYIISKMMSAGRVTGMLQAHQRFRANIPSSRQTATDPHQTPKRRITDWERRRITDWEQQLNRSENTNG